MQPRFERRTASSAAALAGQARFRAGYDFLRLRADVGEMPTELADWWEDYHLGSDEEREALVDAVRQSSAPRRAPAAPRHAAPRVAVTEEGAQPEDDDEGDQPDAPAEGELGAAPARRRRRRRRKPRGSDASAPAADGGETPAP